jgi:hypothetical protein
MKILNGKYELSGSTKIIRKGIRIDFTTITEIHAETLIKDGFDKLRRCNPEAPAALKKPKAVKRIK